MPEIALGLKLLADFEVDCVVVGGVAAGRVALLKLPSMSMYVMRATKRT
jgi:hypothetical protein